MPRDQNRWSCRRNIIDLKFLSSGPFLTGMAAGPLADWLPLECRGRKWSCDRCVLMFGVARSRRLSFVARMTTLRAHSGQRVTSRWRRKADSTQ